MAIGAFWESRLKPERSPENPPGAWEWGSCHPLLGSLAVDRPKNVTSRRVTGWDLERLSSLKQELDQQENGKLIGPPSTAHSLGEPLRCLKAAANRRAALQTRHRVQTAAFLKHQPVGARSRRSPRSDLQDG